MRADDDRPTDQVILEYVVGAIADKGEAAVRIADITKQTGVSISSIYHFFGDREGLIAAAQVERYVVNVTEATDHWLAWLEGVTTKEQFRQAIAGLFSVLLVPERAAIRQERVSVVGAVSGRPKLAARVAEVQDNLVIRGAKAFERPVAEGWVRPGLDPLATMAWLMGVSIQRTLIEVGPTSVDGERWNEAAILAIWAVIFGEVDADELRSRTRPDPT